ncbi:MAG TPA: signal peptidase I [Clostridiales bacterium]|nr:signal peptidase I [Clostridiales bacterium]
MKDKQTKSKFKSILDAFSVVGYILLICVIVALCYFIISSKINNRVPIFGNYSFLKVMSGSMEPTVSKNEVVLVKKTSIKNIQESDVISYYHTINDGENRKEIVITHRVTQIIKDSQTNAVIAFRTKGDANSIEDSWDVDIKKVIGVVDFGHPAIVKILSFISDPVGIVVLVIFPLSMILISDFVSLFKVVKQNDDEMYDDFFDEDLGLDDMDDEFESFDYGDNNYFEEGYYLDDNYLDYYSDDD